MTISTGSIGIVPPTIEIQHTGQEETVDGITMIFQMTPGSEAPAEMNFLFPAQGALCIAENATHNLHNIIADPSNLQARELEARALEQLAYGAESAPWRNFFLMGARELREGVRESGNTPSKEMVALLSAEQLFDVLAIRIDGPRAEELRLSFNWIFTDTDEHHVVMLSNGALIHSANRQDPQADATVLVERAALNELFAGLTPVEELLGAGRLRVEGDAAKLGELLGLLEEPDPSFAIVTPQVSPGGIHRGVTPLDCR
jgi:alkyl sulfatase BDS1-like metallo-beta-lactamase superfamily hydrolase